MLKRTEECIRMIGHYEKYLESVPLYEILDSGPNSIRGFLFTGFVEPN